MAEPETLAALKRAYADTLLNTTKEAAARVLVSEKKARSYQQELVTVRDEALHTLLRLKHMFDSKVKETEMISLKQQQKIEELEAQLGEAEDIVGELRLELRELRDELKKYLKSDHEEDSFRKNSDPEVSCSDERSGAVASCCIPVEQSGSVVANGIKIPSFTRRNSIKRCSSKGCHHTLPSILSKRREAEGCTQMIHTVIANGEVGDVNGVCLHRVPSCKSVENLEMPGCADASDSSASVFNDVKDGEDSVSLKTSTKEHGNDRKPAMGETEAKKEGKESCGDMEVSASPLCEETPVLAVNKSRCIKYTFQRKRKKEVLSNLDGDSSFEESRKMKQKTGEKKEDGYLESLKPSSSQDSLRVAQVAQQPVPFLEKKGLQAELVNQNGQRNHPPYANGPEYVLSSDIARFIVEEFERYRLRLFKMEDVSVGMWVEHFKNTSNPVDYRHSLRFCQFGCVENYYTAHYQSPRQMICLWDKLLRQNKPECCNMR